VADLFLKRTLAGFSAADEASADAIKRYKLGDTFRATVVKPRNLKNHRRWWALCNLIYQNSDQFKSADQVHDYLKILAGHCSQIVSKSTGEVYLVADSISFGSLDEIQFQDVFSRATKAVAEHILPGINLDDVSYEIERLCGFAA
jgi:hypothetical protein